MNQLRETTATVFVFLSIVAAIAAAIVMALLIWDYSRRTSVDPFADPRMIALKSELAANPDDASVVTNLRDADLALRVEYFANKNFMRVGGWLLLGVCVVLVVAARATAWTTEMPPTPEPGVAMVDTDWKGRAVARSAVFFMGISIVGGMIVFGMSQRMAASRSATTMNEAVPGKNHEPVTMTEMQVTQPIGKESVTDIVVAETTAVTEFPSIEEFAANWAAFRGSFGEGTSKYENIPKRWNIEDGENVRWSVEVPLDGNSSPVVWGDRVFVTGADETARKLFAYSTEDGGLLWTLDISANVFGKDDATPQMGTGYASPTPVTDGRHVAAIFAAGGMVCADINGNRLWEKNFGIPKTGYGYASSLAIFENRVIVLIDQGTESDARKGNPLSRLYAFDIATGEVVWETVREVPASWASPVVAMIGETPLILTIAIPAVIAYDARTGTEIWRAEKVSGDVGPTPTWFENFVYAVPNDHSSLLAIDTTLSGDHVVWRTDESLPAIASPLATQDFLFTLTDGGTLACSDRADGAFLWYRDLDSMEVNASPSAVGKYLYLCTKDGNTWVLEPTRDGCLRLDGSATDEKTPIPDPDGMIGEELSASPAFLDGRIYLRGAKHLFCIEEANK